MNLTPDLVCSACGDMIPWEPAKYGDDVIEVGGAAIREWTNGAADPVKTDDDTLLFCDRACMIAALQAKKGG